MTSVNLQASLQQMQSTLAAMFPGGATPSSGSDQSTLASFQQILASLSSAGSTAAGGVLGLTAATTATAGVAGSTGTAVTGSAVVSDAQKYLGVPYVLDGESTKGIDCSGLVQRTYSDLGITLPRTVHEQKLMGTAVPSLAQAQPGDLIVFKGGGHVAIYEGNNMVIHAPYPGRVVSNQKLWVGDSGIETIRRIVPSAGTATPAAGTATTSSASSTSTTSAAVQAAALATVQAVLQADYGLLSSTPAATSTAGLPGTGSSSSSVSSALAALQSSLAGTAPTTSSTTASPATQQALAVQQAILAQEQL
jgi:cell wall-associated NlpC family hydrolase